MTGAELVRTFERNGYVVVPDLVDREHVRLPVEREYEALLANLVDGWVASGALPAAARDGDFVERLVTSYAAGLDWFQPFDISLPPGDITADTPFHAGEAVFRMMTDPAVLDVVERLIGPEISSNPIQHVRIKVPPATLHENESRAHITATSWHQDRAVGLEESDGTRMVTVWIAMNDATLENGCLCVVPGSHREPMRTHCPAGQLSIPDTLFDAATAVPVPVPAGGAVLLHPLTIHGSRPNTTDGIRWSFDLRYHATGEPSGRPMFPEFVARSRRDPTSTLRDAASWRARWEEARDRLAGQGAPVAIHRWDGAGAVCA